jgi:hypothetical protein
LAVVIGIALWRWGDVKFAFSQAINLLLPEAIFVMIIVFIVPIIAVANMFWVAAKLDKGKQGKINVLKSELESIENSKPIIQIKDYGDTDMLLRKIVVATSSFGMPSGTSNVSDTASIMEIAYNPPRVEFQVSPYGNVHVAYIDFINCPKIKTEKSYAIGITANIEFVESKLNMPGKWGDKNPNITSDKRELLKTTIEPNCQLSRRLYVAMKYHGGKDMYGFSKEYWNYETWEDPNAILPFKKYRVVIKLSGNNELVVPPSMEFELENTEIGLSFKKVEN